MSQNKLTLSGFEELKAALRALPEHLAHEAGGIVTQHAESAAATVRAGYEEHALTGNLAKGLKVEHVVAGNAGVIARVKSTSRHAGLFDNGSEARHYTTSKGNRHDTGKMWGKSAPTHLFVRTAIRERRAMVDDLIAMVQREGLTVRK